MKIGVIGVGYVGSVTLGCLASLGHKVIGIDISKSKIDSINKSISPVKEPELDEIFSNNSDRISGSVSLREIIDTDLCFISINTPNDDDGTLFTDNIEKIVLEILALAVKNKKTIHLIIRSTVNPGTCQKIKDKAIKYCKREVKNFNMRLPISISTMPEFLREGSAVYDFYNPPYILCGVGESEHSIEVKKRVKSLFSSIQADIIFVKHKTAEFIKFANNSFHANKVAFTNEISSIAKSQGVDSAELMEIFCSDNKLNISSYYMKPGFAFGGSCLPKDLQASISLGKKSNLDSPLLNSIIESNRNIKKNLVKKIEDIKPSSLGIIGLSFKKNTDDMRQSPIIFVIQELLKKDYKISIFDVNLDSIHGQNLNYVKEFIPHIESIKSHSLEKLVQESDLLLAHTDNSFVREALEINKNLRIIDLTINKLDIDSDRYEGLTW